MSWSNFQFEFNSFFSAPWQKYREWLCCASATLHPVQSSGYRFLIVLNQQFLKRCARSLALIWFTAVPAVEFHRSDKQGTAAAVASHFATAAAATSHLLLFWDLLSNPLCTECVPAEWKYNLTLAQLWKWNPEKKQWVKDVGQHLVEWTLTSPSQPFQ